MELLKVATFVGGAEALRASETKRNSKNPLRVRRGSLLLLERTTMVLERKEAFRFIEISTPAFF